ncbi:MAG: SEC-C metal-binding domain-containing protein [Gallionella sp.]|nr:SEC-C metal-binding domain-containing protein [Gallionella sp.]
MKPSRNDPCPCGSGKKYKKCCQNILAGQSVNASQPISSNDNQQPSHAEENQLIAGNIQNWNVS